jgi:uncharacterized protein (UPF0335 family)
VEKISEKERRKIELLEKNEKKEKNDIKAIFTPTKDPIFDVTINT